MTTSFKVRFKCPYGDQDGWVALPDREEPLAQILATPWDFECPTHGVQREFPVEARVDLVSPPRRQFRPPAVVRRVEPRHRSSKRISLHAMVLVYGRTNGQDFVEETSTLLVNAGGALLTLSRNVSLDGAIFVVNKATKRQQECRVAYIGPALDGRITVGIGFKSPALDFWKIDGERRPLFRSFHLPLLPWTYRIRKRYSRRRPSPALISEQAIQSRRHTRNRRIRSNQPKTGHIILVLAASLIMGAITPWGLTLLSDTWSYILLPQSPELRLTRRANQLAIGSRLAVAPAEGVDSSVKSAESRSPEPAEPALILKRAQLNPNEAPKLRDLSEPWSSKAFIYNNPETKETIPAMVIRMPDSDPGLPNSYWAFSLKTPVTHCQLEYITDLRKLLTEYGFRAEHPMVGDPCTHSLFDPVEMADLPNGNWARGAITQGYALRPPLGIEIHIKGDRLVPTSMEREF